MSNNNLELARRRLAEMQTLGISVERLDPIEKARRDPKSKVKAIAAKCWLCVGAGNVANPREDIRNCIITTCPLHSLRPYVSKNQF